MTKVIAIANQKGGVGKTSTTINLGAALKKEGKEVLMIDLDPQSNLTQGLGIENPDNLDFTISDILRKAVDEETIDPGEGIITTEEGLDLMPSNIRLSGYEAALVNEYGREGMLKTYVDAVRSNYDYILIDCAPSLNILAVNALAAADSVLIPTQPQYFSTAGLQMFIQTINKVQKKINRGLEIEGVLVTMMDRRPSFTRELVSRLREMFGGTVRVFETEIPTSVRMTESSALGKSILSYDPKNKVALAYEQLAREVTENEREEITRVHGTDQVVR